MRMHRDAQPPPRASPAEERTWSSFCWPSDGTPPVQQVRPGLQHDPPGPEHSKFNFRQAELSICMKGLLGLSCGQTSRMNSAVWHVYLRLSKFAGKSSLS